METAEQWAYENYDRQLEEKFGEDAHRQLGRAALFLTENPNDPEAHKQYFEAIERICRGE